MAKKSIYALYRGDEFIDLGTLEELEKRLNINKNTIYFYSTPAYKKRIRNPDNTIVGIKVEDDQIENAEE